MKRDTDDFTSEQVNAIFENCATLALVMNYGNPMTVFEILPHGQGLNSKLRSLVFEAWKKRQNEYPFYCPNELWREVC